MVCLPLPGLSHRLKPLRLPRGTKGTDHRAGPSKWLPPPEVLRRGSLGRAQLVHGQEATCQFEHQKHVTLLGTPVVNTLGGISLEFLDGDYKLKPRHQRITLSALVGPPQPVCHVYPAAGAQL